MAKSKAEVSSMSKADMVREANKALGGSAKPQAIQAKVLEMFDTEISTQMISSYKSNDKKKGDSEGSGGPNLTGTVNLADIAKVRQLMTSIGPDQLHRMIDALK